MPSIYRRRRKDGTFAEYFTTDVWITGKKLSRSTGRKSRRDAEKKAVQIEAELKLKSAAGTSR